MKRLITMCLMLVIGSWAYGQEKQSKEEVLEVKTSAICEMCQYAIEKALAYEKGVKIAALDLETKVVTIKYNPKKTTPESLRERISLTGYHADDIKRDPEAYECLPMCCKDGSKAHD